MTIKKYALPGSGSFVGLCTGATGIVASPDALSLVPGWVGKGVAAAAACVPGIGVGARQMGAAFSDTFARISRNSLYVTHLPSKAADLLACLSQHAVQQVAWRHELELACRLPETPYPARCNPHVAMPQCPDPEAYRLADALQPWCYAAAYAGGGALIGITAGYVVRRTPGMLAQIPEDMLSTMPWFLRLPIQALRAAPEENATPREALVDTAVPSLDVSHAVTEERRAVLQRAASI